jgi:hypothetical protein
LVIPFQSDRYGRSPAASAADPAKAKSDLNGPLKSPTNPACLEPSRGPSVCCSERARTRSSKFCLTPSHVGLAFEGDRVELARIGAESLGANVSMRAN